MPAARATPPKKTSRKKGATRRPRARKELVLNRITSSAVQKATGKTWEQWLKALDAAGAKGRDHKTIVSIVAKEFSIGPWWQQMVTVGYEIARSQRVQHQKSGGGFEISASRTIGATPAQVFGAFHSGALRQRWLPEPVEVRRATRPRSLRITYPGAVPTSLSVDIYPRPGGRASVTVNHGKLASAAAGQRMKKLWTNRLHALKVMLET